MTPKTHRRPKRRRLAQRHRESEIPTFFHGTTQGCWAAIQAEGVLWGRTRAWSDGVEHDGPRYTYLSPHLEVAQEYGNMVLEVEYEPVGVGSGVDNYGFDPPPGETCWQFSVFAPISLDRCSVYEED